MSTGVKPAAMFVADLHFSENAPVFRALPDVNWIEVQQDYVTQLKDLWQEYGCPLIFVAGDLLNVWHSSAYLISCLIDWMTEWDGGIEAPFSAFFAIPGNHDLPSHSWQNLYKSAYWTLHKAKAITSFSRPLAIPNSNVIVHPFPHGVEVKPPPKTNSLILNVALIHDYIWTEKNRDGHATEDSRYGSWVKKLKDYDVAVFGDNHKPFLIQGKDGKPTILNCGSFMRRHSDEHDLKPGVGLLYPDGTVKRVLLDTSRDRFLKLTEEVSRLEKALEIDLAEFAAELTDSHAERVDYARTVIKWAKRENVPDRVVQIILSCLKQSKVKAR